MAGQKQLQVDTATAVDDSYPLSPMQEGMLVAGLSAPHSGVHVAQVIGILPEDLDLEAFHYAWSRVLERHDILRAAFRVTDQGPRQQRYEQVRLPFESKDWRSLSTSEQHKRLEAHLAADRRRGFDCSIPPLMRLALFQTGRARHLFAWTFHHLILDGRSVPILLDEVFRGYEGRDLPASRPYREYLEWLQQHRDPNAESFWRNQLEGFKAATPLAIGSEARKAPNRNAARRVQTVTIPAGETACVRALAERHGLTVATVLQGAWSVLLHRYGGGSDAVFGVVCPGRSGSFDGADSIVGPCANILPLRIPPAEEGSTLEWLRALAARNQAIEAHEQASLADIRRWCGVPPDEPIFETLFSVEAPSWDAELRARGGPWAKRRFAIRTQPDVPLWMGISVGRVIAVQLGYDPGRFEDQAIGRMLGHFQTVLQGMAADVSGSVRVSDLPLLTDAEHHQLFTEWQGTRSDYPRDKCVHELFEAQVERTPNAVALVDDKEDLSYRELDNQANRVAHHLRSLNIGPDVPVGICVRRSAEMVVGMLGILKAGGAYLPLDPALPKERLLFMLEDSGASVLLTQDAFQGAVKLQGRACRVVRLEALRHATGQSGGAATPHSPPARPTVLPDNLAYIVFTSGTTGSPKGVELSHRGLVNLIAWHQRALRVTRRDRATQVAEASFDASVWELWPYLTAGASVHIVDDEKRESAPGLMRWLNDRKITISFLPTPLAEQLLTLEWPPDTALRALLTGGEKLHSRPPANLPFGLVNHYGPAETTVVATSVPVAPDDDDETLVAPPIGRPIANSQAYVLDASLQPVPVGVPGELYIGGDGLARGYRNNPGLTAEKFVPHPLGDPPGARLYRTGDRVRWRADGTLEFIGRVDQQVKIQGFRIEPGEIESQLNWHPAVRESLVVAREDGRGQKRLVAYLTSNEPAQFANKELTDFLRRTLPDYMVPSVFIHLDAWPLTPGGKVDRNALPAPKASHRPPRRASDAPRTPVEATTAQIWSEILGCPRVGVHDNFFELRGNSLLAAQTVSRVKQAFQVHLSIRTLFAKPTVAELAREIERLIARRSSPGEPVIARVSREAYRVNPFYSDAAAELVEQNCEET